MTKAEEAFAEAERRIAVARTENAEALTFDREALHALSALPPSIGNLKSLRQLDLDRTSISDLSPLAGLPNLEIVRVYDAPVSDLSPLFVPPFLTELSIGGASSIVISQLSGINRLRSLVLTGPDIDDLSPLKTLSKLDTLRLVYTNVNDLSPLGELPRLNSLTLAHNSLLDFAQLEQLTELRNLIVIQKQKVDLSPLVTLRNLERLSILDNPVEDINPLSDLHSLILLSLRGCNVEDVRPISGLTNLRALSLDRTRVYDLRPILPLRQLAEEPIASGLTFEDTAATHADKKIEEISRVENDRKRSQELFEYLRNWSPPVVEPDPLVSVAKADERLEIAVTHPTEAEIEERLKQVLYHQLRGKAADLARGAGNRYPKLAARARSLEKELRPEFAETDLLTLHLAVEDLRLLHELGAEEQGDPFPEEVLVALSEVLNRGPGVTLGNPDVDTLVERANRRRASGPEPEADRRAQDALSDAIVRDQAAMGDRLRAVEARVLESGSPEALEVQRAANRNVLWRIAATLAADVRSSTVGHFAIYALGPTIATFVTAHLPILLEAAATYGPSFNGWFVSVMSQDRDLALIAEKYRRARGKRAD
jgi:Leucine-rich repeat (LRR) protein